jgi:hypothetical protein
VKNILRTLCISAALSISSVYVLPIYAQEQKETSESLQATRDISKQSLDELRNRRRSIERDLRSLSSRIEQINSALVEVNKIETSISPVSDLEPDWIVRAKDNIERMEMYASIDIREAQQKPEIDPSDLKSNEARNLYAILLNQTSTMAVPASCRTPTLPINEEDKNDLVDSCVTAFNDTISKQQESGSQTTNIIMSTKAKLEADARNLPTDISNLENVRDEVDLVLNSSDKLTSLIVKWTIPIVGILLIAILLGPKVYSEHIQAEILSNKLTLELITVYILVTTILILGLANRIQNEVLGTLLGGISGYVLGRSLSKNREGQNSQSDDNNKGDVDGQE